MAGGRTSARLRAAHRSNNEGGMDDSVTFKLKDGTTAKNPDNSNAGPYPCWIHRLQPRGDEGTAGDRTTAQVFYEIGLPAKTHVKPFWRAHITNGETGETALLHVREPGVPTTNETVRIILCEYAQS